MLLFRITEHKLDRYSTCNLAHSYTSNRIHMHTAKTRKGHVLWRCAVPCRLPKLSIKERWVPQYLEELENNSSRVIVWAGMGGNWLFKPRFFDDPVYRSQYFCDLDMLQELVHATTGKRNCTLWTRCWGITEWRFSGKVRSSVRQQWCPPHLTGHLKAQTCHRVALPFGAS